MENRKGTKWVKWFLPFYLLTFLLILTSCSDEESEADEWDNWQWRNEVFFASLQDSLRSNPAQWKHIRKYSLDEANEGSANDYIYAKVIEQGQGDTAPCYTDSVRIIYQGRLIPTTTYPEGYVFDGTVTGAFSPATASTTTTTVSVFSDGFATALQHMHRGDHWRVYIPSQLAYGEEGSGTILGHSTLIFDIMLIDFCHAGESMPAWSSRQRD